VSDPDQRSQWVALVLLLHGLALATTESTPAAAAPSAGIPMLMYHEIVTGGASEGDTVIALARFVRQMQYLADAGYQPISLTELVHHLRGEAVPMPRRPVVLTFDDGWLSALNAVPVLEQHGFKASFWIIAGKGIGEPYMDWDDVRRLAAQPLFEIGSHSLTHPWDPANNLVGWVQGRVAGRGLADAREELTGSRAELALQLGQPVRYLAWPCGWYDETLIAMARAAGYDALLTAEHGLNQRGDDPLRIRRTFVHGACDLATFAHTVATGEHNVCGADGLPIANPAPPIGPTPPQR
jgi:peptidoglycan/xylan/chitin deacetylase (PgdA/CDA1 family)